MQKITIKDLESKIDYLNKNFKDDYQLSGAYGGIKLINKSQSSDVLNSGFTTKSRLYDLIRAYIAGVTAGIDSVKR